MYTQCPHCQTLFRINTEQLKAAYGKAHCCRCDRVFNAIEQLRDGDDRSAWQPSDLSSSELQQHELPFDSSTFETSAFEPSSQNLSEDSSQTDDIVDLLMQLNAEEMRLPGTELDEALDDAPDSELLDETITEADPFEPEYDLTDPDEDSFSLDSQFDSNTPATQSIADHESPEAHQEEADGSDFRGPPPPESFSHINAENAPQPTDNPALTQQDDEQETPGGDATSAQQQPAAALPFDLPEDLPDIQPSKAEPLSIDQLIEEPKRAGSFAWSMAIVLLLATALGQLAWYQRDMLMQYPEGRQLFESMCQHVKCQLPPRTAPEKIRVVSRSIIAHPDNPQALQVELTMNNRAPFIQPLPYLQLSLFTTEEHLVARRTFSPVEYGGGIAQLPPDTPVTIRFEVEDPGEGVTGFQFDFL